MLRASAYLFATGLLAAAFASARVQPASAATFTVLYNFCHGGKFVCSDGKSPTANLIVDAVGNLYGTASAGGSDGSGTVFELAKSGNSFKYSVLHNFICSSACPGGGVPVTSLIMDTTGNLYGTATAGGSNFGGTAFELTPNAAHTKWAYKVVYNFCSQTGPQCLNGSVPLSPLAYAGQAGGALYNGSSPLYGTTLEGGASPGVLYQLVPNNGIWIGSVIHSFCSAESCSDGSNPEGALAIANGTLYGAANGGGNANNGGVSFQFDISTKTETPLHAFCSAANCKDGNAPGISGALLADKKALIGATGLGGADNGGLIYQVNLTNGKEKTLYAFCRETGCADGEGPSGALIKSGSKLIGTAGGGDASSHGVLFQFDPSTNAETVLHTFCAASNCTDGATPLGVVAGPDGSLFCVTQRGGALNDGVIYELTP